MSTGYKIVLASSFPCPRCGRAILFLTGQEENVCAWCETKVPRGLG